MSVLRQGQLSCFRMKYLLRASRAKSYIHLTNDILLSLHNRGYNIKPKDNEDRLLATIELILKDALKDDALKEALLNQTVDHRMLYVI